MSNQLPLFPNDIQVAATYAHANQKAIVVMCSYCGTLISTTATKRSLGACPACGGTTYQNQTPPVGPFHPAWAVTITRAAYTAAQTDDLDHLRHAITTAKTQHATHAPLEEA